MSNCLDKKGWEFTECLARQFARAKWEEYLKSNTLLKIAPGFGPNFKAYYRDEIEILNAEHKMKVLLDTKRGKQHG